MVPSPHRGKNRPAPHQVNTRHHQAGIETWKLSQLANPALTMLTPATDPKTTTPRDRSKTPRPSTKCRSSAPGQRACYDAYLVIGDAWGRSYQTMTDGGSLVRVARRWYCWVVRRPSRPAGHLASCARRGGWSQAVRTAPSSSSVVERERRVLIREQHAVGVDLHSEAESLHHEVAQAIGPRPGEQNRKESDEPQDLGDQRDDP